MSQSNPTQVISEIYRCSKKEGMYLYVIKADGLSQVPDTLTGIMGELTPVMTLLLNAEKKLARVDVVDVLSALDEQGFYLQMPPAPNSPAADDAIAT